MTSGPDYRVPPRIYVGAPQENPVLLTRQDWRGNRAGPALNGIGHWELNVVTNAHYDITLRFARAKTAGEVRLDCCGVPAKQAIGKGAEECVFRNLQIPAVAGRLETTLRQGPDVSGVKYVEIRRLE